MMKIVALFFMLSLPVFCTSQDKKFNKTKLFQLQGQVIGRDTGILILRYINNAGKLIRDTNYLKKGKFEFKGNINEPTYANIRGYSNYINFYDANDVDIFLEAGFQYATLIENKYEKIKVLGSKTQNEKDFLQRLIDSVNFKYKFLNDEFLRAKKEFLLSSNDSLKKQKADSLYNLLNPSFKEVDNIVISFIIKHSNSYVSSTMLAHLISTLSLDSAELLYNGLTNKIKNSRDGAWDLSEIRKKRENVIGAIAPDFKVDQINGKMISLLEFKGKFVLLEFWASWCIPCRKAMPYLKELFNQYHSHGFEIITISIDKNKASWKKALEQDKLTNWNNVLVNADINKKYVNVNLPISSQILIDKSGKIIWTSNNNSGITLEMVLKEQIQ